MLRDKGRGSFFSSIAAPVSPPEALASAAPPRDPLTSDRNPKTASVESLHRLHRGCLGYPAWTLNLNARPLRRGSQLASLPLLHAALLAQLLELAAHQVHNAVVPFVQRMDGIRPPERTAVVVFPGDAKTRI